jgi:hypothetical protein
MIWAEKLVGDFTGIVQCDGYASYKNIEAADRKACPGTLARPSAMHSRVGLASVCSSKMAAAIDNNPAERALKPIGIGRNYAKLSTGEKIGFLLVPTQALKPWHGP